MDDVSERWLPVVNWDGLYEVSDQGRVRSLPRSTVSGIRGGKVLRFRSLPTGYLRISLYSGERKEPDRYVHDLVAEAFIGPKPEGQEVRHGPGGKADNRLVNLSYGTHIANCEDRARDLDYHKLNRAKAAEVRARAAAGMPQGLIAAEFGIGRSHVSRIVSGHCWADGSIKVRTPRPRLTDEQINDARRRRAAGESQRSIARDLGVDPSTIARYVRAEHQPDKAA